MTTYRLQTNRDGSEAQIICREHEDGRLYFIPCDDSNSDFIEYKEWRSKGNRPLLAAIIDEAAP